MAQTTDKKPIEDIELIVDADGHTIESLGDLLPYIENEPVKDIINSIDAPLNHLFKADMTAPKYPFRSEMYGEGVDELDGNKLEGSDSLDHSKKVLNDMGDFGIDHSVLTGGLNLFLPTINPERYAVAIAKAYNDWVLDKWTDVDNTSCAMVIPHQDPTKAAEEIDRVGKEDGIVGVQLATAITDSLAAKKFRPIFDALEKHELPLLLHISPFRDASLFPMVWSQAKSHCEQKSTYMFNHMWHLTSLIFQGVPEQYPSVDFVFQESGFDWVPYARSRMDHSYFETGESVPEVAKRPSEYIDRQFYFTTQPLGQPQNPKATALSLELTGPESVMYSADLPHPDFDAPEALFDRINGHFEMETLQKVMGGTAKDVFGIN